MEVPLCGALVGRDEGRSETVTALDVLTSTIHCMQLGADLRDREAVNQKSV